MASGQIARLRPEMREPKAPSCFTMPCSSVPMGNASDPGRARFRKALCRRNYSLSVSWFKILLPYLPRFSGEVPRSPRVAWTALSGIRPIGICGFAWARSGRCASSPRRSAHSGFIPPRKPWRIEPFPVNGSNNCFGYLTAIFRDGMPARRGGQGATRRHGFARHQCGSCCGIAR